MPYSEIFWFCVAFAVGAVAGSFLNVLVFRLPVMAREEDPDLDLWSPRSRCPHCLRTIQPLGLIPILGYLVLRGRCAFCETPISPQYPLLELVAGLLAVGALAGADSLAKAGAYATLGWGLMALGLIDWRTRTLPDLLVYPLLWLGLLANARDLFAPTGDAVIGAVAGYLSLWLLNRLFYFFRNEPGMGHGDFKMFAVCGAWLGWAPLPWVALAASILTLAPWLVLRARGEDRRALPFGPALGLALFGALVWQDIAEAALGGTGL